MSKTSKSDTKNKMKIFSPPNTDKTNAKAKKFRFGQLSPASILSGGRKLRSRKSTPLAVISAQSCVKCTCSNHNAKAKALSVSIEDASVVMQIININK